VLHYLVGSGALVGPWTCELLLAHVGQSSADLDGDGLGAVGRDALLGEGQQGRVHVLHDPVLVVSGVLVQELVAGVPDQVEEEALTVVVRETRERVAQQDWLCGRARGGRAARDRVGCHG